MITLETCNGRLEELVYFVARLNSESSHHIGFFGEGEADVRASLAECLIPPGEGFRMAYEDSQLVGIFGVDADPEVDRAWLFGPIVEHADWDSIADQLYAEILPLIPANIHSYDIFCDAQNSRVEAFARRHGFPLHAENAILTLERDHYRPVRKTGMEANSFQDGFFEQFELLHKELFPNAYFTARQMVGKQDQHHRLLMVEENGQLLGYHFCKIDPEAESGYVDFIGTAPEARGRGLGAALLASGLDWMFSAPTTKRINLTVNANNQPARRLYEKFGFMTSRIMRGYRKSVSERMA